MRKTDGVVFINSNDAVLANMAKRFKEPILYPEDELALLSSSPFLAVSYQGSDRTTQLVGRYNYINIAAALAVGSAFGVDVAAALDAVASYVPDNSRSQVIRKGEVTIILDAYNANPDSMKAALENLGEQNSTTMAILGDMNELENPQAQHQEVLDYANSTGIKEILTVGPMMGAVADNRSIHFASKEALEKHLKERDLTGYTVLLKASNSIKLESITKSIS